MTNNHNTIFLQNPIFLLSSSYRPPINPVSIPYQSRIGIRKQYGNNTGLIRDRYGNDRRNKGETYKEHI